MKLEKFKWIPLQTIASMESIHYGSTPLLPIDVSVHWITVNLLVRAVFCVYFDVFGQNESLGVILRKSAELEWKLIHSLCGEIQSMSLRFNKWKHGKTEQPTNQPRQLKQYLLIALMNHAIRRRYLKYHQQCFFLMIWNRNTGN